MPQASTQNTPFSRARQRGLLKPMKTKLKTKNVPFLDSYRNKSPRSYEFVFLFNTPEYFLLVRVWLHFLFSACPPWAPYCCAPHFVSCCTHLLRHLSLTRVTKSYLLALGTTQISSYFTKHWTKFLTHQTGNYPVTCFVSKPSRITSIPRRF